MAKVKALSEAEARELAQELSDITAKIRKKEAKMTEEINVIRQKYATDSEEIVKRESELISQLEKFSKQNDGIFPTGKKSVEWGSVIFTKRTTTPKCGIPTGTNWDEAIEKMKTRGLDKYVRVVEEADKELIIATFADPSTKAEIKAQFAEIGITVTQSERYKVEVKAEEL